MILPGKLDENDILGINFKINPPNFLHLSPKLHRILKSKVKEDIFSILPEHHQKFNSNKEEYLTMWSLQNDRSVIIKPAVKGSSVVVWDRNDYLKGAERQISDISIYKEVKVTEENLVNLVIRVTKCLRVWKEKTQKII